MYRERENRTEMNQRMKRTGMEKEKDTQELLPVRSSLVIGHVG